MTPDLYAEAIGWLAIITVWAGLLVVGGIVADYFDND